MEQKGDSKKDRVAYGTARERYQDLDAWKQKIREAIDAGLSQTEFTDLHNVTAYEYSTFLRPFLVGDKTYSFNRAVGRKYKKKMKVKKAGPKYQSMPIFDTPEVGDSLQPQSTAPLFTRDEAIKIIKVMGTFL